MTRSADTTDDAAASPSGSTRADEAAPAGGRDRGPWPRRLAWVLASLTVLLALSLPMAPVVVDTPEVQWPRDTADPTSTAALFMPYRPIDLDATVPCATIRSLDDGGSAVAFATALQSSERSRERALFVTVDAGTLRIVSSGTELWAGSVPSDPGCSLVVRADQDGTTVLLAGSGGADEVLADSPGADVPEVTAFVTDATAADGPSPTAVAHPDARFQSSPTPLKLVLVALHVLGLAACLEALRRGRTAGRREEARSRLRDDTQGGRPLRLLADVGVIGALVGWTAIGFINTDDYYYTLEARTLDSAGFVGNQIRYFNVPEIPFVLEQTLLAPLADLSTSPFVLRLPSLAAAIAIWFLLTRQLLPLLVQRPHAALRLVAGIAFLAWWLPWNIGGRPEWLVCLAWTVTLVLALQAIRRDRVWLIGAAAAVAGAAVTITASGLACAATLLVLTPKLWPVLARSRWGAWASLALVVACASIASTIVFSDATLATARTALRVHQERGPAEPWYEETLRYWYLTLGPDPNQSTSGRAVVVLGTLVLVVGVSVVLLRTTRRTGPLVSWAVPALGYLAANAALLPSPTKWTHHFGALAAPGALAVTVAVALVIRRRPDRWASLVLTGVLALTAALAYHGGNHQVEYSGFAVDEDLPGILGNPLLWLAIGLLVVAIPWWRGRRRAAAPAAPAAPAATADEAPGRTTDEALDGSADQAGATPARWPDAVVGTLVAVLVTSVLIQVGSAALATYRLRDTWSMGRDTLDTLTGGGGCGFADHGVALVQPRTLSEAAAANRAQTQAEAGASAEERTTALVPAEPESLPGADPDDLADVAPQDGRVWSTWRPEGGGGPAVVANTPWLELSSFSEQDALAVTIAGEFDAGTGVVMEYARIGDGAPTPVEELPVDIGGENSSGEPEWRQFVLGAAIHLPRGADVVRLRVEDLEFSDEGWIAVTDPYRIEGRTVSELVGDEPVALDWPIGFNMPCIEPPVVADGMVQPVRWLVQSDTYAAVPELTHVDSRGGSYATAETVADETEYVGFMPGVYPFEEWGVLVRLEPELPEDGYTVTRSTRVVPGWGWWPGAGPGPSSE